MKGLRFRTENSISYKNKNGFYSFNLDLDKESDKRKPAIYKMNTTPHSIRFVSLPDVLMLLATQIVLQI